MARILLVDDEQSLRDLLQEVLEIERHEVTVASDGRGALAAIGRADFDLVITDLVMPDMEGIETIIALRKQRPNLPVIAMSGGGRGSAGDYLEVAAQLGVRKTLAKPFPMDALVEAVTAVLGPEVS